MVTITLRTLSLLFLTLFFSLSYAEQIYLWENGAPGFEDRKNEKERAKDWWVKNVHNPSITVFHADTETKNKSAVLIFPGGGHRELVFDEEGTKTARYLNSLGISAFVLKYRLAREENSPYKLDIHPRQDAQRALRYIRANAEAWGIDKNRIGVLGFSAGGEVATMVAYEDGHLKPGDIKQDKIDQQSAKVNFQILIYPGPLGVPETIPATAPPAFVLTAADDPCCAAPALKILAGYMAAGLSVEGHFYREGGHGFNMGDRSSLVSIQNWPTRLGEWLKDAGY